jgi:hypothetical protein
MEIDQGSNWGCSAKEKKSYANIWEEQMEITNYHLLSRRIISRPTLHSIVRMIHFIKETFICGLRLCTKLTVLKASLFFSLSLI